MLGAYDIMQNSSRIFVAGHRGLVGSAIMRKLEQKGHRNIVTRSREELDLLTQSEVYKFFADEDIEFVFVAAAKVGGIYANKTFPANFLHENLVIASNLVDAACKFGVKKLLFLGSSCIYPRMAPQPIQEESLLSGSLEPTNEAYAIAKIAGLKLCEMYHRQYGKRFISAMPTNLYGPNDNFHPQHSHVIPGMIRRFHEARIDKKPQVVVWGTGKPRREFLHVDDLSEALYVIMQNYEDIQTINVGCGSEVSIAELAGLIREVVGYQGDMVFDHSKPDGTPRKLLDIGRLEMLGWTPEIPLREGLERTYQWAIDNGAL